MGWIAACGHFAGFHVNTSGRLRERMTGGHVPEHRLGDRSGVEPLVSPPRDVSPADIGEVKALLLYQAFSQAHGLALGSYR